MSDARRIRGSIADELSTTGDVLFRWRSYVPLALLPLFVLSVNDGRLPTLEDTVEFFNVIGGLGLELEEKKALVAFMRAL